MASVVCASREIDPNDIAPVANRLTISDADFDLSDRNRRPTVLFRRSNAEEPSNRQELLALLVESSCKRLVAVACAAADGVLQ